MIPDLTIYPGLARALSNKGHAAAFMFWTLCRAVDAEGRGSIAEATVKAAALEVWTLEKYYRYRREARDLGLVRPWDNNKKHEKRLSWLGLERACRQFSVRDPGAVAVVANPSCLASAAKFKAAAFCAFQAARNSANPISRATLKELTAVGTKTQAVYEQRNNARGDGQVKAKASFMLTGYSADHLRLARQEIHRGCYLWGGEVVRPLPNTYSSTIRTVRSSRLRKVKKQLRNLVDESGAGQCGRVFFDADDERDAAKILNTEEKPGQPAAMARQRNMLVKVSVSHRGCNIYKAL